LRSVKVAEQWVQVLLLRLLSKTIYILIKRG
jgi:hypothetical protein